MTASPHLDVAQVPYYRATGDERAVFTAAYAERLPVLLKGPTGCGKSRFVEAVAAELGRPLVTVACNDETSAADLLGRFLVRGGDTIWQDGPVTRAVREGAILYLDEIAEAREDVIVVLHPLSDHRREVHLDRRDETVRAADDFSLIVSCNPGYQHGLKQLKPSTRQRFVTVAFDYPSEPVEAEIVATESGVDLANATRLVKLAHKIRATDELGLVETVSTRLVVHAARLIRNGLPPRTACRCAIVEPISDDPDVVAALQHLTTLAF